jgi:hypothetical protein
MEGLARYRVALVTALAAAAVASGCTGSRARPAPSTTAPPSKVITAGSVPSPFPVVSLSCSTGRPNFVRAAPLSEVRGQSPAAGLWALVFDNAPFTVGRPVKIAWHMTGTGPLRVSATNLDTGRVVGPFDGPDFHSSSSWHRPGDEWGSVWVFPSPGCWRVTAARATGTGSVTLSVMGPPE